MFPVNSKATCSTPFCLYLLSCKTCSKQFLDFARNIKHAFSLHLLKLNRKFPTILYLHFSHTRHINQYLVDLILIDHFPLSTSASEINSEVTSWKDRLSTYFPYGLNSKKTIASRSSTFYV